MAQTGARVGLNLYVLASNPRALEEEAEKFFKMAWEARELGLLKATKFEYAILNRAIQEGPERVSEVVRHFNGQKTIDKMMKLARQAELILPFLKQEEILSEWSQKQISRYLVRGRLRGECEVKLQSMVESMTHSFLITELIKATRDPDKWSNLVKKMKQSVKL